VVYIDPFESPGAKKPKGENLQSEVIKTNGPTLVESQRKVVFCYSWKRTKEQSIDVVRLCVGVEDE
jgi:hypothetical protein